jgi:hypothetical protein
MPAIILTKPERNINRGGRDGQKQSISSTSLLYALADLIKIIKKMIQINKVGARLLKPS